MVGFALHDSYHIAGVIPSNFQYDDWFQLKLTSTHGVIELYIYTKFYHVPTTESDAVVDYSHVRGWSFPPGLSRCYEPILYHHKHKSTADKAHILFILSLTFYYGMSYCFLIAVLY